MSYAVASERPGLRLRSSRRTSEFELIPHAPAVHDGGGQGVSPHGQAQRPEELHGYPLRYPVKIQPSRTSRRNTTTIGNSLANTPQPFLGSHAPFPYGTASVPPSWEPISRYPFYLSVPPLYDSDKAEQVHEPPLHGGAENQGGNSSPFQLSHPSPMSVKRRIVGCFPLLLLGLAPFLVGFHVSVLYPPTRDYLFLRIYIGGIYLCMVPALYGCMLFEARVSQLGKMLQAEVVAVDDVGPVIDRRSQVAPVIAFSATRQKHTRKRTWSYDHHEDVAPSSEEVVSYISQLISTYDVVRLRLPVRVVLADDHTRGKFMTALHSFYLEGTEKSLSVEVLHQDYVVVIVRTEAGLPRYFHALRAIFSVSVYLSLSWIPRMVVLLFFPQWVDPAFSPVYCHRKLLTSRAGL